MNISDFAKSFTTLESITSMMNRLEVSIKREQAYIAKWGKYNDENTDEQWEMCKADAQFNLDSWDALKARRDTLKAA